MQESVDGFQRVQPILRAERDRSRACAHHRTNGSGTASGPRTRRSARPHAARAALDLLAEHTRSSRAPLTSTEQAHVGSLVRSAPVLAWADTATQAEALDAGRGPTWHRSSSRTRPVTACGSECTTPSPMASGCSCSPTTSAGSTAPSGRRVLRPDVDWSPRTLPALLGPRTASGSGSAHASRGRRVRAGAALPAARIAPRRARQRAARRTAPWRRDVGAVVVFKRIARPHRPEPRRSRMAPSHVVVGSLAAAWSRAFGDEPGPAASVWLNSVNCRRQLGPGVASATSAVSSP